MTVEEMRNHKEYKLCMDKLKSYKKGFSFSVPLHKMNKAQKGLMLQVIKDAEAAGIVENIAVDVDFDGEWAAIEIRKL